MILGFSETNPTLGRAMCSRFPGPQALPWDFLMPVKEKLSERDTCDVSNNYRVDQSSISHPDSMDFCLESK